MMFAFSAAGLALVPAVFAATAQQFVAPGPCATCSSPNYVGKNNGSLPIAHQVPGRSFRRFIQIWLENTDYNVAASSPTFQKLAKQGITLSSYLSLTHPSEPNYISAISGDFWGLGGDDYYHIPDNITTVVDLLEKKGITWATYQENMPRDGWLTDYTQQNYVNTSAGLYNYFMRKHSPLVIHDRISNTTSRAARIRNFNDFAADVKANAIPQWNFVTPNMVNDAHDTTIDYASSWLEYWLVPLLKDERFNSGEGSDGTLILLTFDENKSYTNRNNVFSILLGSAVPQYLHGTTDDTLYSHYSTISTVEGNWGLDNLGRGDVNKTMGNVFDFVAKDIGFTNTITSIADEPDTRQYAIFPGPLNPAMWHTFTAPTTNVSRFGGKTLAEAGLDWSITPQSVAQYLVLPYADVPAAGVGNIVYEQVDFSKHQHPRDFRVEDDEE
jgi:hypothetical protein